MTALATKQGVGEFDGRGFVHRIIRTTFRSGRETRFVLSSGPVVPLVALWPRIAS